MNRKDDHMRLVFLGPPGAGKGTQGARLCEHFGLFHIATGDILRRSAGEGNPVGVRVKELMDRGELVPDELINELVGQMVTSPTVAKKGFVLDGYPRNVPQAEALDSALETVGARLDRVVRFMIIGTEIARRISGRRVCPVCKTVYHVDAHPPKQKWFCDLEGAALIQRPDDREETVLRRLEVYGQKTRPLFDFYSGKGLLTDLDAMGTEDEVFRRLLDAIK